MATLPKAVRLAEVFRRMEALPAFGSMEEARTAFDSTLTEIEDLFSGALNKPDNWRTDGRMYPVQDDRVEEVDGHPGVWSLLSANRAMEVRDVITDEVVFAKLGADGKGVWS